MKVAELMDVGEPLQDFKVKVIKLFRDIGWGEPSNIEPMVGGGFNRVFGVEFPGFPKFVLWAPRSGNTKDLSCDLKDEVALLEFLRSRLPVARVHAFDSTKENAIHSPYMIMARVPGVCMIDVYYSLPLEERLQITTAVAETMKKIERVHADRPGRCAAVTDFPNLSDEPLVAESRLRIKGFRTVRAMSGTDFPIMGKNVVKMLDDLFQRRWSDNFNYLGDRFERYAILRDITAQMVKAGLIRDTDNQSVMWHWDLASRNMMMQSTSTVSEPTANSSDSQNSRVSKHWEITAVLDLDWILAVPLLLARQPPT